MAQEAGTLLHTSNAFHHKWSAKLAELLVSLTQREGGLGWETGAAPARSGAKVFFANSGTEANEGALKIARKVGKARGGADKVGIVCFENAFHGRSMGALSVTSNPKYQQPFTPLIPGVKVGKFNATEEVGALVDDATCAVIVEPIQGEGGIHLADREFLRALRKRCDETGAVLIYDEIQVSADRYLCKSRAPESRELTGKVGIELSRAFDLAKQPRYRTLGLSSSCGIHNRRLWSCSHSAA